jgi:hypothetical protein
LIPRYPSLQKDGTYLSTIVGNRLPGNNTTTYIYDAASTPVLTVTLSSRLQSIFTHSPIGRLTQLATPVSSCDYPLGAVGNRTAVTEGNGRTVNWNYEGVCWLTNETISVGPARTNRTVAYGLDPVGVVRKSETSTFSGLNPGSFNCNTEDEEATGGYDVNGTSSQRVARLRRMTPGTANHLMSSSRRGHGSAWSTMATAKTVNGVTTCELDGHPSGITPRMLVVRRVASMLGCIQRRLVTRAAGRSALGGVTCRSRLQEATQGMLPTVTFYAVEQEIWATVNSVCAVR